MEKVTRYLIWPSEQVTGKAKSYALENKALAALFIHTLAGELQREIITWLVENFEFIFVTGDDTSMGQLELISTAIMDGWMAGLGATLPPNTDAFGQLLTDYTNQILRQSSATLTKSKKKALRTALDELTHRMPSLLAIDHPCAQRQIANGHYLVELIYEEEDHIIKHLAIGVGKHELGRNDTSILSTSRKLALARRADGTRARYSRLYSTLAMKVPASREVERGGQLKDVKA
ncbi:hypothetical protein ACFE04_002626 [Oxalis oulophora]